MMGKGGPGRIRGPTIDEKTKVRISKALQRNLQRQQAYGGATTVKRQVAGTASSVAFTPLQVFYVIYSYQLFRLSHQSFDAGS
jgi:U4/U6 small nuclear ribonucleoprotein PRP31